jgi:transposase
LSFSGCSTAWAKVSGSPQGAKASAALYNLIETAKANGFDPYWYLRYLFDRLPDAESSSRYEYLLQMFLI